MVIDIQRRKDLIHAYHAGVVDGKSIHARNSSGHFGQNKTLYKLIALYYWGNIKKDVEDFVSSCDTWQRAHTTHLQKIDQTLHPIRVLIKMMSMVGIDLMQLKQYKGYHFVTSVIDYLTKYIKMGVLKTKSAEEVTTWIFDNLFCRYGITNVNITKNGTEFVNKIEKQLYERTGCVQCITSPYHPNANRLIRLINNLIN